MHGARSTRTSIQYSCTGTSIMYGILVLWAAEFVLWASSYQSCMGECMGLHTFCMEPPIHAWCAQYSSEHTVHDLI